MEHYNTHQRLFAAQVGSAHRQFQLAKERDNNTEILEAAAACIRALAEPCLTMHAMLDSNLPVPGIDSMYFYMGDSDVFGRVKLGITGNVQKRAKSLRASMITLGFPGDYQMFEWTLGETKEVRSIERQAFRDLAAYRVAGEWFAPESEVFDWFFDAERHLVEHYADLVSRIDVEQQIAIALDPAQTRSLFDVLNVHDFVAVQQRQSNNLTKLWKAWDETFSALVQERDARWGRSS